MVIYSNNSLQKLDQWIENYTTNPLDQNRLVGIIQSLPENALCMLGAIITLPKQGGINFDHLIAIFRNASGSLDLFTQEEINAQLVSEKVLADSDFRDRMIYTVTRLLTGSYPDIALALVDRLEQITKYDLLFDELSEDNKILYRKLFVLIMCAYSSIMSDNRWGYFLRSHFLILALIMDVDILEVLTAYFQTFLITKNRHEISIDFGTHLLLNEAILGINHDGKGMLVREWVEKANEKVDLKQDLDYLANDLYVQSLIQRLVVLYDGFVSGYFVMGPRNETIVVSQMEKMEKDKKITSTQPLTPVEVKNLVNMSYGQVEPGQYWHPDAVFAYLQKLADQYNDPSIVELLYWDESEGKFKWKE